MDLRIKQQIRKVIEQKCTWLEPVEDNLPSIYVNKHASYTIHIAKPSLAFRVKRRRKGFFINRIIRISECMLDDALNEMKQDSGFLKRHTNCNITIGDVETIISIATYGTLKLDLYDF